MHIRARLMSLGVTLSLLCALAAVEARGEHAGTVFVDANANGARDVHEAPAEGVAVTNGRAVVVTDDQGHYAMPPGPDGLVYLTRPTGFTCEEWYREGGGDFALVPTAHRDAFFFVHMSDGHVWDTPQRVIWFLELEPPWWLPRSVFGWFALRFIEDFLPEAGAAQAARSLRAGLAPHYDGPIEELWDSEILPAYMNEVLRPGSELGDGERQVREAFAEISALGPTFLVNTGDIVMDSTAVPSVDSARWMRLYREASERGDYPVYNTIGNHGLGHIYREDADPSAPDYGPGFFRQQFGPSYYSFDLGGFHFVALDTHQPPSNGGDAWTLNRMRPEVAAWLEADLARHADRVRVVVNHEPFRADPSWPYDESFEEENLVADEVLARHGVEYALTGHAHLNGLGRQRGTMHIHTGALSGLFWLLPTDLFPRGYRLIYARDGRLYTAWKDLGIPVLGLAEPGAPDGHVVAVAADRAGPFRSVRLELDGEPVPHERWGDYFLHARVAPAAVPRLVLIAVSEGGESLRFP